MALGKRSRQGKKSGRFDKLGAFLETRRYGGGRPSQKSQRLIEPLEERNLLTASWPQLDLPETQALIAAVTTTGRADEFVYLFDESGQGGDGGDGDILPQHRQSRSVVGIDQLRANPQFAGFDGSGFSIVVIDTGADLDHRFFGPDLDGNGVSDRIVFSFDFNGANDADASDFQGHGTHVAGTAAGNDALLGGMAPGANLIILKTFPDAVGGTSFADLEECLQWVVANGAAFNVASVNMSLGAGNFNSPTNSPVADEIAALTSMGISVVAASGNSYDAFQAPGVGQPSSDPGAISVGSIYDSNVGRFGLDRTTAVDRIVYYSQRSPRMTTVFAPGALITSAWLNNGINTIDGTSMASPHVAGIIAVVQHAATQFLGRRLDVAEIVNIMQATGATIFDGDDEDNNLPPTNASYARIDALGMVAALAPISGPPPVPGGEIHGTIYADINADGNRTPDEPGSPGELVFIDANDNAVPDQILSTNSRNQPQNILDAATITSFINVTGNIFNIADLNVRLNITHTRDDDLDVVLISPSGTRVRLFSDVGGAGANFNNTTLDDEAPTSINAGTAPFFGRFQPQEPLSILDGEDPNGLWRLEITDDTGANTGRINSWTLSFTFNEPVTNSVPDDLLTPLVDETGNYAFHSLRAGLYKVALVPDPGCVQTSPIGTAVLVTEAAINSPDKFEIQNVSDAAVNTDGWFVAVSGNPYGSINQVNPTVAYLPPTLAPGEIQYWTDSIVNNYFGANIFWNGDNNRIGSGWVMIVNNEGEVQDWLGWGWSSADLASFNVTVGGFQITSLNNQWVGNTVNRAADMAIQRGGTEDTNSNLDFSLIADTVGSGNSGLQTPLASAGKPIPQRVFLATNQVVTGVDFLVYCTIPPSSDSDSGGDVPPAGHEPGSDADVPPSDDDSGEVPPASETPPDSTPEPQPEPAPTEPPPEVPPVDDDGGSGDGGGGGDDVPLPDDPVEPPPAPPEPPIDLDDRDNVQPLPIDSYPLPLGFRAGTIGLYDPATGTFFQRHSNTSGVADATIVYGPANQGWLSLTGDFDGDGEDTLAVYNPATGTFYLRNDNSTGIADVTFMYGPSGDNWQPIVGDWNGDGRDTIGLYDPDAGVFYLRDDNSTGFANLTFQYGPSGRGWRPTVGDWNGDGIDTVSIYDPQSAVYYLANQNATGFADLAFQFGPGGNWVPMSGDWDGDTIETIGAYDPAGGVFYLRNDNSMGFADVAFSYGAPGAGWLPVIGDWTGMEGHALRLDAPGVPGEGLDDGVTLDQLEAIVDTAIGQWASIDLSQGQWINGVSVIFSQLGGDLLGLVDGTTLYLDDDAAGRGWFLDSSPGDDDEYTLVDGQFVANPGGAADGTVDLYTVLGHALGRLIDWDSLDPDLDIDAILRSQLSEDERDLPDSAALEQVFASLDD
jgi:subtilisin-like proprotein convertase family protein